MRSRWAETELVAWERIVEGHIRPVSTRLVQSIDSLRRAGVPVEEFVAAYGTTE